MSDEPIVAQATSSDQSPAEEWRDIPGYEGKYQVSNMGRVKAERPQSKKFKPKVLAPVPTTGGYLRVSLSQKGVSKSRTIHRLVMLAFVGSCPVGYEVDHINYDVTDNRLANLRYVTCTENLEHRRPQSSPIKRLYRLTDTMQVILHALAQGHEIRTEYGRTFIRVKLLYGDFAPVSKYSLKKLHDFGLMDGYQITDKGRAVIAEYGIPWPLNFENPPQAYRDSLKDRDVTPVK